MSDKIDQIVDGLKTLTLVEASELVAQIEETFLLMQLVLLAAVQ